jgi:DNA-binding response OmpR family regulator
MIKTLLVDDDSKFRVLFKRFLEKKYDFLVFEAEDGIQGLEIFDKEKLDLVFLDIDLPKLNGREFLEQVRKIDQIIPVIILTNLDDRNVVREMVTLGIQDYLLKTKFVTQMSDRVSLVLRKLKLVKKNFGMSTGF